MRLRMVLMVGRLLPGSRPLLPGRMAIFLGIPDCRTPPVVSNTESNSVTGLPGGSRVAAGRAAVTA
jgi:hypothetical protein